MSPKAPPLFSPLRLVPAVSLVLLLAPTAARADVGVRVPLEATPDEVTAIEAAIRTAQGAKVRTFAARPGGDPASPLVPSAATEAFERARRAYKNLEMDVARAALAEAEAACVAGGACAACRDLLFDAHVLAGAVAGSLGRDDAAVAEFVAAHAVHPSRVVDPRRFPPKIVGAFARACADADKLPSTPIRVVSKPPGASLAMSGTQIRSGAEIAVRSHRVYVEARLAGFSPRCEAIDPAAAGASAHEMVLAPLPAPEEEGEADRLLAATAPALDAAAIAFLARIGVDRFVALSLAAKPHRFAARAAHAGAPAWVSLPPLATAADAASPQFAEALAAAVGEPRVVEAPPPPDPPPEDDLDDLDDDKEDDSVVLDPDLGELPDGGATTGAKVFRSPWLWISLGVVLVVVGGVVIGT
ncbi:MAG: hypothetical protein M0R80_19765, partial [Proteobacteria bacterium]|nr:hypothetical protein [Pseudomonadota bacterium]